MVTVESAPKVSLVLPSLNVRPYIEECLDSVINQTLKEIEMICVDAGSTDGTLEILERYAAQDARIVVLHSDIKSYGYQMNMGMKAARGEYIGIVETDDLVPPEMYEELYKTAAEHHLDFVKADFYRFKDVNGVRERTLEYATREGCYHRVLMPRKDKRAFSTLVNTWNGIYKRAFLEAHDIRHNESPGASFQDNGFWLQTMMFADQAMFLDTPFYLNRRDNPTSSVFRRDKVFAVADEYRFMRDLLDQHPDYKAQVWPQFVTVMLSNYEGTMQRLSFENRRAFLRRYASDFRKLMEDGQMPYEYFSDAQIGKLCRIAFAPDRYDELYYKPWHVLYESMAAAPGVILYGAGKMGRQLFERMQEDVPDIKIRCFAVTSMDGNDATCCGQPVCEIGTLADCRQDLVVVAMGRKLRPPVCKLLKEQGFENVAFLPLADDAVYEEEHGREA